MWNLGSGVATKTFRHEAHVVQAQYNQTSPKWPTYVPDGEKVCLREPKISTYVHHVEEKQFLKFIEGMV
jgi:hypothetical protein